MGKAVKPKTTDANTKEHCRSLEQSLTLGNILEAICTLANVAIDILPEQYDFTYVLGHKR